MQNRLLEVLLLLIPSGLLTTLVYLYLNAGKPTKQVRRIILVNSLRSERRRRKEVAPELLSSGAPSSGKTQTRGEWEVMD